MFAGKKSAQIREILISESAWEEMTCLFAPSLKQFSFQVLFTYSFFESLQLSTKSFLLCKPFMPKGSS
ncbi:membrane protein insertion efficiency factor YidD [Escherichia coli]|nr:membrane protein insertion efficiency factor YidD [Escherichia coli]